MSAPKFAPMLARWFADDLAIDVAVRAASGVASGVASAQQPGNFPATSGKVHRIATLVSTQQPETFHESVRVQSVTVNCL